MRRLLAVVSFLLAIVALVSVIAFAPYAAPFRERLFTPRPLSSPTAAQGPGPGPASPASRGDVVIDAVRQQLTGVRLEPVRREPFASEVRAAGVVRYDETRQAEVNTRLAGWIRVLYADYTGRMVQAGEPLFTLYSPELVTTQNEYLLALRGRAHAGEAEVTAMREFSERLVQAARDRLRRWELTDEDIKELEANGVGKLFGPGTATMEPIEFVRDWFAKHALHH